VGAVPASEDKSLQDARSLKNAGQWLKATEVYKQLLSTTFEPGELARVRQEIGFCLRRAAAQSSTIDEFRQRARDAEQFYLQAAGEFESIPEMHSEANHCRSAALICRSLPLVDPLEKQRILNEARMKETEAFRAFAKDRNIAGAAESCSNLLEIGVELVNIQADPASNRAVLQEGLEAWDALFRLNIEIEQPLLAILYSRSSWLRYQAALFLPDEDQRKASGGISLEHARSALKLALASQDTYSIAFANIRLAWATDEFTGDTDSAEVNFRDALVHASRVGDRWLKASAHYGLCFVSYWRMGQEEDYERMKTRSIECEEHARRAIEEATPINYGFTIALACAFGLAENYYNLARLESDDQKQTEDLTRAIEMARKAVEEARRSGSGLALSLSLHSLSKALHFLAIREKDQLKKRSMLSEALGIRKESIQKASEATPFFYWNLGVFHSYLARITADLAEDQPEDSRRLLEDAAHNMEKCIELCRKTSETLPEEERAPVAWYLSWYGDILAKLYLKNPKPPFLEEARAAFHEAAAIYEKAGALGNAARMRWQTARTLAESGEPSRAADTFEDASRSFELAAGKTPKLTQIYLEYSTLTKAESYAQRARLADREGQNNEAVKLFLRISDLLETSARWRMFAPFYKASAVVERAEASSKSEDLEKAPEQFRHARSLFMEVERALEESLRTGKSEDERTAINQLVEDAGLRSKYCLARAELEDGKLLSRKLARPKALEKFARARTLFEEVGNSQVTEDEREQLQLLAMSCTAEEKLALGDERADPNAYAEASQIFQTIRERSRTKSVRTLALGHLCYFKALENGAKYLAGQGSSFFDEAKMNLERAVEAYSDVGSKGASGWAEATRSYLDAHAFLDKAETAIEVDERLRLYKFAEKCLREAANLFEDAGYHSKKEEAIKSLQRVKKRRKFAISLQHVLASPPTSTPVEVSVAAVHEIGAIPSPKELERPNVQGMINAPSEVEIGGQFEVQFDLVNAGNAMAVLVKLERALPKTWNIVQSPGRYQMVDGSVNLAGKRLDPVNSETVSLVARSDEPGFFEIRPRVVFIDDLGQLRTRDLATAQVTVLAPLALNLTRPASEDIFKSLLDAFVTDHRDRRVFIDKAGWRSMVEIARAAKVPRSSLYGAGGRRGSALSELQRKGLAEMRIFPGERGRGGRIMKIRVSPASLQVQAHLRNLGVKIHEK
jgi:tetratricopeptide (TPR) repeat protein